MKPKETSKDIEPKFCEWATKHGTPWEVRFPKTATTPYQRRYFATEEEALAAIKLRFSSRGDADTVALGKRRLDAFLQAEALLPKGVSVLDAVRHYIATKVVACQTSIKDIIDRMRADHIMHKARPAYVEQIDRAVRWLEDTMDVERVFASVTKADWITFIKGDVKSYWNRYARKRLVSILISKAREIDAIKENPLAGWNLHNASERRASVLTAKETEELLEFTASRFPDYLPAFVLQLYFGIRTEELSRGNPTGGNRLLWKQVVRGRGVSVPGDVAKIQGERDFVDFWPAVVDKWLPKGWDSEENKDNPVYPGHDLAVNKRSVINALNAEERVPKGLKKFPFRQNCFRHTFASMACAYFHDAGKASLLCRQRDKDVFWRFYKERVDPEEAPVYFGMPSRALWREAA